MKLIDNAGVLWHKLWSVRLAAITAAYSAAAGAWAVLPPDLKPDLSNGLKLVLAGVGVALPALAGIARVVEQPKLSSSSDKAGA